MDKADSYLDRVTGLPPAPIATPQLLNLLDEPGQDIDQVGALLREEPYQRLVVTLKLANNLAYLIALEDAHICDPTQCTPDGITVLGLTADDIPNLVEQVEFRLRGVQRFSKLSFDQPAHAINMLT